MRSASKLLIAGAVALSAPSGAVSAAVTFQVIGPCLASDVSADGSVVVGNTIGDFETFRWTQQTGIVPLGRATVPVLGQGSGTPDVSYDGTRISATILDDGGTFYTWGRWTQGSGWQQLMPPTPPDGGVFDSGVGSTWALSGDGSTVTGFYWRPPPATGGVAHAAQWKQGAGVTTLGSAGRQSSGRGANYDGSVIVGWDENPTSGNRRPAVWVNGIKTVLDPDTTASTEAAASDMDGKTVVGHYYNATTMIRGAAIWRYNGTNWNLQDIGALPGTAPNVGLCLLSDVSGDGELAVGFNRLSGSFATQTGIIWTQATGLISAGQFLSNNGVTLPAGFTINQFTAVSADGSTIVGVGTDAALTSQSFLIRIPEPGTLGVLALLAPLLGRRRQRFFLAQSQCTSSLISKRRGHI